MRRRTAAILLLASLGMLALSQLRVLPQDQGVLLELAGTPVDAAGGMLAAWQRLTRRCGDVTALTPGSARWLEAQQALSAYSPPASLAARPVQVLRWGTGEAEWLLAEVRWADPDGAGAALDPAIVPLARRSTVLQVQAAGVWSGDTGPWRAPVFIRRFLAQRLPALPEPLRQCLDPQLPPFDA
jgi:hypothetical protein